MKNNKLLLGKGKESKIINNHDIIYCESKSNHTFFRLTTEKEKVCYTKPLKTVEALLPKGTFFRCHKSYIVNINHIDSFNINIDEQMVQLKNQETIKLSKILARNFSKSL
ncbi:LytR/AlgR family response regulator transcription factor [Bacteroidota bacterium]